jgi:hypothetical protein
MMQNHSLYDGGFGFELPSHEVGSGDDVRFQIGGRGYIEQLPFVFPLFQGGLQQKNQLKQSGLRKRL